MGGPFRRGTVTVVPHPTGGDGGAASGGGTGGDGKIFALGDNTSASGAAATGGAGGSGINVGGTGGTGGLGHISATLPAGTAPFPSANNTIATGGHGGNGTGVLGGAGGAANIDATGHQNLDGTIIVAPNGADLP